MAMSFALGLCSGLIFHIAGAALGLGLLLKTAPTIYDFIRYLGLGYLIFLSIQSFRAYQKFAKPTREPRESSVRKSSWQLYRQGILMNVLNPKVTLFFLSFFPQFIKTEGSFYQGPIGLGLIFIAQAMVVFFLVSVLASKIKGALKLETRATHLIEGLLYLSVALLLSY